MLRQISVFLENKAGRLAEVPQVLAACGINISALCIADTEDFGILRLLTDDAARTQEMLTDAGFTTSFKEVLAIGFADEPGALAGALETLSEAGVAVEYMYTSSRRINSHALLVLKVSDTATADAALRRAGYQMVDEADLTHR